MTNFEKWKATLTIEKAINLIIDSGECFECPIGMEGDCSIACSEGHCKIMLDKYFTEGSAEG